MYAYFLLYPLVRLLPSCVFFLNINSSLRLSEPLDTGHASIWKAENEVVAVAAVGERVWNASVAVPQHKRSKVGSQNEVTLNRIRRRYRSADLRAADKNEILPTAWKTRRVTCLHQGLMITEHGFMSILHLFGISRAIKAFYHPYPSFSSKQFKISDDATGLQLRRSRNKVKDQV